eukprot:TRINITY_DN65927_c0_g1_i1.p1 TRINITY_DN65927_c0_g1~~TRINITY_DN65927_c0_g1_i1.p1  ORF type:complete len:384 (-),score=13.24 TRINITY_DN65927_c0_g1_i1:62-1213(-)
MSLDPQRVKLRWRKVAWVIAFLLVASMALYLVYRAYMIMQGVGDMEMRLEPHFGTLPIFVFQPEGLDLRYLSLTAFHGMGLTTGMQHDSINVTPFLKQSDRSAYFIDLSSIALPEFTDTPQMEIDGHNYMAQPALSFVFLGKESSDARLYKQLHIDLKAPDNPVFEAVFAWIENTCTSRPSWSHHRFEITKNIQRRIMTIEMLNLAGLKQEFQEEEVRFKYRNLVSDNWAGPPLSNSSLTSLCLKQKYTHLQPLRFDVGLFNISEICGDDSWYEVVVDVFFPEDQVQIFELMGPPILLFRLLSSAGGLWTIISMLFLFCFVKRNPEPDDYVKMEERTFMLEEAINQLPSLQLCSGRTTGTTACSEEADLSSSEEADSSNPQVM